MELKEYIRPLLKWWWLIVAATAIAAVSSYFATQQQPLFYQSTTTLVIGSAIEDPNPTSNDLFLSQRLASYYVELSGRSSLRDSVRESLGLSRLPEISVRENTNFIDISVTDTDPERAQAVAAEMARQLILRTPTAQAEEQDFANELLQDYETAIRSTKEQITAKQEQMGELISASEVADAQAELATLENNLRTLETNYANLRASTQRGATNTIRVIEPASLPQEPLAPNNTLIILTSASIGFVLAAGAAYVLAYLDDTIKTPAQITRLTDLPVLAGIAEIKDKEGTLITVTKPRDPVSEAFRVLRTGIQFSSVDNPNRKLLVTGSVPKDGKSTTAANVAAVLAQAGHQVLLVDADLRRPQLHKIFDVPNKRGLTSLLLGYSDGSEQIDEDTHRLVQETTQATQVEGLQLLTSGPVPPNPSELLGSKKMKGLLDSLGNQFDFLILDSPPVLSVTDAAVLSTQVDGVMLIVRAQETKRSLVSRSVEILEEVNANLLGCVLNGLPERSEGYRAYYYYQDHYYHQPYDPDADESADEGLWEKVRRRFRRKPKSPQSGSVLAGNPLEQ